jgi:uncharacterized coiled-coil protein SlyX
MADDDVHDRLTDLEVRLAYQDRTVATLDEVVRELTRRLAALETELGRLRDAGGRPASSAPTDEP